jgi:hypothetical protein
VSLCPRLSCRTITIGNTTGLQFTNNTQNAQTKLVFRANLLDANVAFRRVVYAPLPLENGEDTIHIEVNDLGNRGTYGEQQITANDVSVWIVAVNSAPTVRVPASVSAEAEVPLDILGIAFSDPDVPAVRRHTPLGVADSRVRASLTVRGGGRITLATLSGLRFIQGSGHVDAAVTLEGALVDVNNAVANVRYLCSAAFDCAASTTAHAIDVVISDVELFATGGSLSARATFPIVVTADPYP